jgi:hypothetical protein
MPEETEKQITAPKSCRECEHWQEIKHQLRVSELLAKTIHGIEERLKSPDFKVTLADYLKLLQLEKEMDEEAPTEIKVTWIEPASSPSAEK